MTTQNQKSYRSYLQGRYDSLMESHGKMMEIAAKPEHAGDIANGYYSLAANVLSTAAEIKNALQHFNDQCDPSDAELNERLILLQNHGTALQSVLMATKMGMQDVMDVLQVETGKLTVSMIELKSKCISTNLKELRSHPITSEEILNAHTTPVQIGHT